MKNTLSIREKVVLMAQLQNAMDEYHADKKARPVISYHRLAASFAKLGQSIKAQSVA